VHRRLRGLPGGVDASRLRALIIDEGELTRSVLSTMLRDIGVQHVHSARRPESARRMIKDGYRPTTSSSPTFISPGTAPMT